MLTISTLITKPIYNSYVKVQKKTNRMDRAEKLDKRHRIMIISMVVLFEGEISMRGSNMSICIINKLFEKYDNFII